MNKFQYFLEYYNGEPLIIQLVWMVSCLLFLAVIILIIYLKFLRVHLRENEKITEKYTKDYELLLITYLYAETDENGVSLERQSVINELEKGIKNTFKRKIIVATFLKLGNEITGEMAESIHDLYSQTKLKKYALSKLKNRNWYIIARGIRELTLFHVKDAHDQVVKHVNHSRREVRKEVQLYLVNLFHFDGLKFLDDLQTPLSEWDQIQLLEELQKLEDQQIPDISLWLRSANKYVVIFALKLAKIYNQFGMKDVLIELISQKDEKVRLELIPVLSHLHVIEAKEVFKNNFNESSKDEQIAFFKLLENLIEPSDEPFIIEHIYHENFEVKYSALKLLKVLNAAKFENLELTPPESDFVKIVEFIKNN